MPTLFFYIASYFAILLVAAFAIVLLRRLFRREPLFTEGDWLCLFGYPRDRAFNPKLLVRFLFALVIVIVVGLAEGVFLLPLGMAVFLAAVVVTIGGVVLITPRFLRLPEAEQVDGSRQAKVTSSRPPLCGFHRHFRFTPLVMHEV